MLKVVCEFSIQESKKLMELALGKFPQQASIPHSAALCIAQDCVFYQAEIKQIGTGFAVSAGGQTLYTWDLIQDLNSDLQGKRLVN